MLMDIWGSFEVWVQGTCSKCLTVNMTMYSLPRILMGKVKFVLMFRLTGLAGYFFNYGYIRYKFLQTIPKQWIIDDRVYCTFCSLNTFKKRNLTCKTACSLKFVHKYHRMSQNVSSQTYHVNLFRNVCMIWLWIGMICWGPHGNNFADSCI